MSVNKVTGGVAKAGGLALGSGDFSIAGTTMTATATELNRVADLSVNLGVNYMKVIALSGSLTSGENDTSYDLPQNSVVNDAILLVTTAASAGATLEAGLLSSSSGGDADGFIDAISIATTGVRWPTVTATSTGYTATTRGTLLQIFTVDTFGAYRRSHMSDSVTAKSVTWTVTSTGTSAFVGKLLLDITEFTT